MKNEFTITVIDIEDIDDRANNECGSITATLTTERGSVDLFEWHNGGEIERTDSHIWTNQKDAVRDLFRQESDIKGLSDLTPWEEIYDSLQAELDKRQSGE